KLKVTEAGQNFFKHCILAIQEIEKGESEISASQEKPRGLIKVTAPSDVGHSLLPRIVCDYLEKFPETEIEMIVTNRIVDLIEEGVDLAIRAGELKDSTLIAKKFFEIRSGFWASPGYLKKYGRPSHPKDLHRHKLILHSTFKAGSLAISDGKNNYQMPNKTKIRVDDFEAIQELLYLDAGIALLPEFLVQRSIRASKLERVLPNWQIKNSGSFYFVYPGQKYALPKVRAFIDLASSFKL
ncbi:MAG: substrate binding domain-containing protein, partial [Pseudobdellovibrionaceae bacterium]